MDTATVRKLIAEFEVSRPRLDACREKTEQLINHLLGPLSKGVLAVSSRLKSSSSLEAKLTRHEPDYNSLWDVTDLIGIRIITYYDDSVDDIAQIINQEFVVDPVHSVDKRAQRSPDSFGYMSLHSIVTMSPERTALLEYVACKDIAVEIQMRSILQHAWAEIEHGLNYKATSAVPQVVRRRFARLAGLLELAGDEFVGIRRDLATYEGEVAESVMRNPSAVGIDRLSIGAFVDQSEHVRHIDKVIAERIYGQVSQRKTSLDRLAAMLAAVGVSSIGELEQRLGEDAASLEKYVSKVTAGRHGFEVAQGAALIHAALYWVGISRDREAVITFMHRFELGAEAERDAEASAVIEAIRHVKA